MTEVAAAPPRSWREVRERGTLAGVFILMAVFRLLGRRAVRALLIPIAFYYFLTASRARHASREYLRRIDGGRDVPWHAVYRHLLRFAQCTLDRFLLVQGRTHGLQISATGHEYLVAAAAQGRGALLLGAHLGSFEVMRAACATAGLRVSFVADFRSSRMVSGLLEKLNPELAHMVIPVENGPGTVLAIQERIAAGELVAVLGDRVGTNERGVDATFLGGTARFPVGPYMLASMLKCPVLLTFGLHHAPNSYELHCEPFQDRLMLRRRHLDPDLPRIVQRFAERLEHYCRLAPDNWFNFFEYWSKTS